MGELVIPLSVHGKALVPYQPVELSRPLLEVPAVVKKAAEVASRAFTFVTKTADQVAAAVLAKITFTHCDERAECRHDGNVATLRRLVSRVMSAVKNFSKAIGEGISSGGGKVKGAGLITLPFDILDVFKALIEFLESENGDQQFVNGVDFLSELSSVAEGILEVLAMVHFLLADLGQACLTVLSNLMPVVSVLNLFGIVVHAFSYGTSRQVADQIEEWLAKFPPVQDEQGNLHLNPEGVKIVLTLLHGKSDKVLKREFSVNYDLRKDIGVALQAIVEGNKGAIRQAETLLEQLRGRLQVRLNGYKLKILASIVSAVGAAILFATPNLPVGYIVVGIGALIGLGNLIYQWRSLHHNPIRPVLHPEALRLMSPGVDIKQSI